MDPAMAIEVAAMSRHKAIDEATAKGDSEVQQFYKNSTVFITGGSGFMGKQTIEKLFRSCKLSKMFVLLRPKKGKEIQERLSVMFEDPVFGPLRKQQPDFEQKIVAVAGDAAEKRLGISDEDWETLTNEVEVIYHMAATTRFDETLQLATMINVRGTREAITLGKACKKLKSYVHVSTAYTYAMSSLISQEVFEQFYPSPIPPQTLISMAEEMDMERLNGISKSLITDWPNTYTFTKAVAEELVRTTTDNMPICIVRPGVVVGAYREPSPGWLDVSCAYGASGIILGVFLGLTHALLTRPETKLDLVPCDYANNAIIVAGKDANNNSGGINTKIYFVSSNVRNPITKKFLNMDLRKNGPKIVTPKAVYYSYVIYTSSIILYSIMFWFMQMIPAYIVDFVCLILGKERRFVKIYTKMNKMMFALSYFSENDWSFVDDNLKGLFEDLSKTDKTIFNFNIEDISWTEYVCIWIVLGSGLGVIHVALNNQDTSIGLVPCDYVNNAIIVAGQAASLQTGGDATKIYTVCSNVRNPIKQRKISTFLSNNEKKIAPSQAIYYVFVVETSSKILFTLYNWLLHYIPAYMVDFMCYLIGKERRFVKIYKKVYKMMMALCHFTLHDWLFDDKNLEKLYFNLSETDKTIFNFNIIGINWDEYLLIWAVGIRKYIIKDGLKDTEAGIRKQFWLKIVHYLIFTIYVFCLWKLFMICYFVLTYLKGFIFC